MSDHEDLRRMIGNLRADFELALNKAQDAQRAWVAEQLRQLAPDLADVPDRRRRFLEAAQRLLVATNTNEAAGLAAMVASEAHSLAILGPEYHHEAARLWSIAPLRIVLSPPVEDTPS